MKNLREKMKLFHVTTKNNYSNIKNEGLTPTLGKNSLSFGEKIPLIYFFKDMISAEDAISNWLGDCYEEDEILVLLSVTVSADLIFKSSADYECFVSTPISKENIKLETYI